MTDIRTQDLRKDYGSVRALDGLTLNVEPGTIYGFLGPNGAGKSTTIRLLTGLARPSGGQAWIAGQPVTEDGSARRRIGYLPEEPAFYGWMTPAEFLDHVGRLFGLSQAERSARVRELLKLVGLEDAVKRRISGFSRGMRQRLGLAQALINRPDVLLLDEPASALDPVGRKEVLDLISSLRSTCTVFMSTHILSDVERTCDAVGIINKGRLVVEAPQDELLSRYSVPAFEIEPEPECHEAFEAWANKLQAYSWVSSVQPNNGSAVRVIVSDLTEARRNLLQEALTAGLLLRRYEVVTPSLEDIFLKLVEQGDEEKSL